MDRENAKVRNREKTSSRSGGFWWIARLDPRSLDFAIRPFALRDYLLLKSLRWSGCARAAAMSLSEDQRPSGQAGKRAWRRRSSYQNVRDRRPVFPLNGPGDLLI